MKAAAGRATVALAAIEVLAFGAVLVSGRADRVDLAAGFVPARVSGLAIDGVVPVWVTPLTAALIHAGPMHLAFNLLMLVYCGRQVELAIGEKALVALFLIGAYAAALGQYLAGPASVARMIGASGAVSAIVGAYAMLYGRRGPSRLSGEAARWMHIAWLAAAWIAIQLLLGIATRTTGIAIATAAHIGGFIAGLLLARPLLRWRYRKA